MANDAEAKPSVNLLGLTADIVAAYVQNNATPVAGLPDLIASVNSALLAIRQPTKLAQPELVPAANPKRSVFPDYIICLEDGKKFKSLKRHLRVHYGSDAGGLSGQMGVGARLPDGDTKLRSSTIGSCKILWSRSQGTCKSRSQESSRKA